MNLLKKLTLCCGFGMMILQLNACASAVFPDFEDEDEIEVGEGGRVIRSALKEGSSLKSDEEHAAYEGEKDKTETPATEKLSDEEIADIVAEEEVASAKTTPVIEDDMEEETVAAADEAKAGEKQNQPDLDELMGQPAGPSVSYRLDTFYFDNGSSSLDSKYNANIRKIVNTAKSENASVIVYGYASSRTRNTDPVTHKVTNFKVSFARAQSVAAALRRAGMPAAKITVEALADSVPAFQEVMPEGERLNRRAEVYIAY